MSKKIVVLLACLVLVAALTAGCGGGDKAPAGKELSGTINIDGSSTVYPVTEAVAEEFMKKHPNVKVSVGVSGTGGGFKRFTVGETDISNASRKIKDDEKKKAEENKIEYVELPIAFDGISVVINKDNDFAGTMTVEELKKLWEPNSTIKKWNQIRPEWPDLDIKLFGPGTDSGTFEYFTEAIVGKAKSSRADFTASEDDNVLVQGVVGNKGGLGYFGYSYYYENKDKLKAVSIDEGKGKGAVAPSEQTINDGTYSPLSRPIFIYVNKASLKKPEVREFVNFYLTEGQKLIPQVGYVNMPKSNYDDGLKKVEAVK